MAGFRRHEFVIPDDPSLQDLVLAIKSEREAREAAMADQQKHLDWRFVHFAEDFNLRIEQVEQRMDQSAEDRSIQRSGSEASDSQRMHLHGGKLALLEARIHEVQRWSSKLEAQLEKQQAQQIQQLQEMQAWLHRADMRLSGLEVRLGRHPNILPTSERTSPASSAAGTPAGLKAAQRLMPVERGCLEPMPAEVGDEHDTHPITPISHSLRGYSGDSGASTCSTMGRNGVHMRERTGQVDPQYGKISWPGMAPAHNMR